MNLCTSLTSNGNNLLLRIRYFVLLLSKALKDADFEQMLKKLTNVPSAAVVPDA